jgi:dTDP-4-dehydrorhamnose 3,5-epimerase
MGQRRHPVDMFEKISTAIPEVLLLRPRVLEDARGFFAEIYHQRKLADLGIRDCFVQENHSGSKRGTVRGLHFQLQHPQSKLCRVIAGEVLDVAVDVRVGSPTFGRHVSSVLSAENRLQIYVPAGFAHGFSVLSETAELVYKCSDLYRPEDERGVLFDDPGLGIDWRVAEPLLSARDRGHRRLSEIDPADLPRYHRPSP